MSADPNAPAPGEIDLETGRSNLPAAEPEPEPIAEPEPTPAELDGEPEPEPVAGEPAAPRKHTGAVAELIAKRAELKLANARLAQIDSDPAIQRLTPEIRQAITEGRVIVQPKPAAADLQAVELGKTANRLGLVKQDGTPDLEAAARVDGYVREVAHAAAAPAQQAILSQQARANIDEAVRAATASGYDADTVAVIRETFQKALNAPNGAAMVANSEIAMELWHSSLGRAVSAGKLVTPKKTTTPAGGPAGAPVIAEPTGRRAAASVVQLSPGVAQVYKNAGLDPTKTITATRGTIDMSRGFSLEE